MDTKPTDDQTQQAADDLAESDDVEGHSVFGALAVSGALRPRASQDGDKARNKADENLTPLTKPFPSMRESSRK